MKLSYLFLFISLTLVSTNASTPHQHNHNPTIRVIHEAIERQTPFKDSKEITWDVHCTQPLPHNLTPVERLLPLISMNSVPVIVSDETLVDFFAGLPALPTTDGQTWIGQKYLYPIVFALDPKNPTQGLINVFLVRLINDSEKTHYRTTPKTGEIELAHQEEFQRIIKANSKTLKTAHLRTINRMRESEVFGLCGGLVLGYALNHGLHVCVVTLVALCLCDSIIQIFRTIGLLPQKLWD